MMTTNANKRIAINTLVIYIRLIIVTCVTLFTTRFVLQALGASDYGLYNVVSSILVMLNCISIGMHTTTRRFINVEMGRPDGNMNKIFNICRVLHLGFAAFTFIVCESLGIWYVNHYLNISPDKMADAHFVLQIAIFVSCLGILNIPYQGLIQAFEKFWLSAVVDILNALVKFAAVIVLLFYEGNALRFYAVLMGVITLSSFTMYRLICRYQWRNVVKFHFYKDKAFYKQIFFFNNYVAIGALGFLARNQGIVILINYFFGTVVNAAYAVAIQIQTFVDMLVNNLATASGPQITQNYSSGNIDKAVDLCAHVNRYVVLMMVLVVFPLLIGMDYILMLWLKEPPEGAALFTKWILISGLIGSMFTSLSNFVMACGKIRWFNIASTILDTLFLIVSYILFYIGFPAITIVILLAAVNICNLIKNYTLMRWIIHFDTYAFIRNANARPLLIIVIATLLYFVLPHCGLHPIIQIVIMTLFVMSSIWAVGLKPNERNLLITTIKLKLKI
jgi:O-antigen/teichoic acid export membrane protein